MPSIVLFGPDSERNCEVIKELRQRCRKNLRNHRCLLNVQKKVLSSNGITQRTDFQCSDRLFEKVLTDIVVNQCCEVNKDPTSDFITDNCIIKHLALAERCLADKSAVGRIVESHDMVGRTLECYRSMLIVLLGPAKLDFDDGIWVKLTQENWKVTLQEYKALLNRFDIPYLDSSAEGVTEICDVLSDAIVGRIRRETCSLAYYEQVAKNEKHGERRNSEETGFQKSFLFFRKMPDKLENIYIPTIKVFEHKYEQDWTDFHRERTNRFIKRHGHANLVCMDFHINVRFSQVHKILMNGVRINGYLYTFLGCSSSGLKSRKCYLWKGTVSDVRDILQSNGDFNSIQTVSKRLSRIGLLFSAVTQTTVQIEGEKVIHIDDIIEGGRNFSDGCGLVGTRVAKHLFDQVKENDHQMNNYLPSVFQIRYQGFKGVLVLDKNIDESKIEVRPSMEKFRTDQHPFVGVCNFSKPYTFGHLNKQFIQLLSGLGVSARNIMDKQEDHFDMITKMLTKSDTAVRCLQWKNEHYTAQRIVSAGGLAQMPEKDKQEVIQVLRKLQQQLVSKLQKLTILVPASRNIFGICDTSGCLDYGECFLRLTIDGKPKTIRGQVAVCKNPCYLLGDMRVLTAIDDTDKPGLAQLSYLKDCIIFPSRGKRPHADEIAGSDLDGDEYFVTWDKNLIPKEVRPPYDYPPAKPQPQGKITEESIIAYFAKQNETMKMIGKVNNFYNKWADLRNVTSTECERLGQLFSRVIDAGKSGEEVDIPRDLKPPEVEKESKFVWKVMEAKAVEFESNFKKDFIQREPIDDISPDFVQDLVGKNYTNISEHDKFLFCWKYSMSIQESEDAVVDDVMEHYSDRINFSLMSIDERKDVIEKGIPRKYVLNALNKSNILTNEDLKHYQMDIAQNTWGEYIALSHEEFDWSHLYKTLTQNTCTLVVLAMPDNVIIELQFLEKLTKGIEQPVVPGTISAVLYSKNFGKTCRYILGAEYVLDFSEDTLQLYRDCKKNLTFVWLKATDRKATKGRWNKRVHDEVVNSISVDLQRFDRRILQGRRHPLVNKTPFIRLEIYAQNYEDNEYPYWDSIDANDILPVEEVPEKESDEEEQFNVDFEILFPSENFNVAFHSDNSDLSKAEENPFLFKALLNAKDERNLPDHIQSHFENLLKHVTAKIVPVTLPEELQSVLMEILVALSSCLTSPLEILTVAAHLERFGMADIARQISQKVYDKSSVSFGCFLSVLEKWQEFWHNDLETVHSVFENLSVAVDSPMIWNHNDKRIQIRQKYIHRLGILHAVALSHETEGCKDSLRQTKADVNLKGNQTSIFYLRAAISDNEESNTISFYRTYALDQNVRFSQGQFVSIQRQRSPGSTLLLGQIHTLRLAPFQMTLKIEGELPQSVLSTIQSEGVRYFRADLIGNIVTYQRVITALRRITEMEIDSPVIDFIAGSMDANEEELNTDIILTDETQLYSRSLDFGDLNEKQRQAVSMAAQKRLCLIQGPPGTGKTKVACHIVKQILLMEHYKGILVVAETNTAVDNLARRLRNDLQIVRVGSGEAVARDLYDTTLEEQVKRIADKEAKRTKRRDQHGDFHRDIRLIKRVLTAADVVLATCSGAGDAMLESYPFEFVLVDEATQTLETTLLCSLVHSVKHLVMIGDHKQLGPTISETSNKDCVHRDLPSPTALSETLFHRLIDRQKAVSCFLDIQHRMHPEIMKFPSEEFYDGKLRAAGFLASREVVKFSWPQREPYKPICFVNVEGRENRRGTSYYNIREVEVVKNVIDVLLTVDEERLREYRLSVTDIAVLTLYQAQAGELKHKIGKDIVVSSVDGFQGQEKEVIVVSTVRCNGRQAVGFSGDPQRINVLLTRAKRGLIVVGNERTLQGCDIWRRWLLQAPFLAEKEIKPVKPDEEKQERKDGTWSKQPQGKHWQASRNRQK